MVSALLRIDIIRISPVNEPENTIPEENRADSAAESAEPTPSETGSAGAAPAPSGGVDDLFPVYAWSGEGEHPRRHLVMTPWMLLDCLKACQDDAYALLVEVCRSGLGEETRYGVVRNPVADRLERINFGIAHILKVLWRGGLWTDTEIREALAVDGRAYQVLSEPFTIGKPGSRPLPPDAPDWQRELLGIPLSKAPETSSEDAAVPPQTTETVA